MITPTEIKQNEQIRTYIEKADEALAALGYTEHSYAHVTRVAHFAEKIMADLGYPRRIEELSTIISAIGNHDESTAFPVNAVAAALILADKTDVRRTRVRNRDKATFDIHDRVNYAVEKASTTLDAAGKAVVLDLQLDTGMSPVIDYFEIFLERMLLCRKAAEKLGLSFRLVVNGQTVL